MTESRKRDRYVDCWETVAVTALPPGWHNVFAGDNGRKHTNPCPAILLQECRETIRFRDVPRDDGTYDVRTSTTRHDPPYQTRAVFADFDGVELVPANDADNYVETIRITEETPSP